jgi:cytochrome c
MIKLSLGQALRSIASTGLFFGWMSAPPLAFAGDAAAGSSVFKTECAECHSIKEGRNKKGPSLFAVVGRKTATVSDYHYSDALTQANWVWTEEKLHSYLSQPAKQANPGTKMKYECLTDPKQLEDLISYLGSVH